MNFKTVHMFKLVTILKKMGLTECIQNGRRTINSADVKEIESVQKEVGQSIMMELFLNIEKADKDIYALLGDMYDMKATDIKNQAPDKTIEMLVEVFKSEGFLSVVNMFVNK